MKIKSGLLALMLALIIGACGEQKKEEEPAVTGNDFVVTIKTDLGEMKAILFDETPKHKENFLKVGKRRFL